MPRWWEAGDLDDGPAGAPNIFNYHLNAEQRGELRKFLDREKHRYDPALWNEA